MSWVMNRHGDTAPGVLNLSQYSDEKIESPVVVFTPSELLNTDEPTPEDDKIDGENGEDDS